MSIAERMRDLVPRCSTPHLQMTLQLSCSKDFKEKLLMSIRSLDGKRKDASVKYLLGKEEDEIVCSFGVDYFAGARCGSGGGGLFTGSLSFYQFRQIKRDHMEGNLAVGLKLGERNPNFSRWTLIRGLSAQPMMTVGCIALMVTTFLKSVKFYLASRRCWEFAMDDAEYHMLKEVSMQDPAAHDVFVKLFLPADDGERNGFDMLDSRAGNTCPSPSAPSFSNPMQTEAVATNLKRTTAEYHYKSMEELYRGRMKSSYIKERRTPTFMDGVAVGLMGSIMDCYLPQKPVQSYYGMRFGVA